MGSHRGPESDQEFARSFEHISFGAPSGALETLGGIFEVISLLLVMRWKTFSWEPLGSPGDILVVVCI